MSLRNDGGFVVQLGFVYEDGNGDRQLSRRTGDIVLSTQREAAPGDLGVRDDTDVRIFAMVAAGSNNEDSTSFRYRRGASHTAHYSISGTTLNNRLRLISNPDELVALRLLDSPGFCNLATRNDIRAFRLFRGSQSLLIVADVRKSQGNEIEIRRDPPNSDPPQFKLLDCAPGPGVVSATSAFPDPGGSSTDRQEESLVEPRNDVRQEGWISGWGRGAQESQQRGVVLTRLATRLVVVRDESISISQSNVLETSLEIVKEPRLRLTNTAL